MGTLQPGVYHFDSTAQLTGTLTLDFLNSPDALFVFQIGTALTTAPGAVVNVTNGLAKSNYGVYWLMGVTGGSGTGSATLDSSTMFAGNIIALDSITMVTNARILCGRAIALNAAVTMDTNTISNDCNAFNGDTTRSDYGSAGFSGTGSSNGGGGIPCLSRRRWRCWESDCLGLPRNCAAPRCLDAEQALRLPCARQGSNCGRV